MLLNLPVLLNNAYSYIVLFILVFASSVVVIPGIDLLVVSFAAFLTSIPNLIYFTLSILVVSILGDLSVYFVMRKFSDKIERWMRKFKWYSRDEAKYKAIFNKNSFLYVFLTRFIIPGAALVLNYISGFEKMDKKKFITAVILGQTINAFAYVLAGYLFKDTWSEFLNFVQSSVLTFIIFVVSIFVAYKIVKYYQKRKDRILHEII